MDCPRCATELSRTNIHELGITCNCHACPTCKGYWVSAEELQNIEAKVERVSLEFRRIPSGEKQMKMLACPQCTGKPKMEKVENERDRKVVMDVCPQCKNIWLDGGEVTAIQQESFLALLLECFRSTKA